MTDDVEPARFDPEMLLAHADWVRKLARGLVYGEQRVDDVVQQTWLNALRLPPRSTTLLKAWLGTVARNVAHRMDQEDRKARRDLEADLPGVAPSADELAGEVDLQHTVSGL